MEPRTLVVVFLRGALDGLAAVAPVFEDAYARLRPTIAIRPPSPGATSGPARLDDRFALHDGLSALLPAFREGRLAVVQAIGSDDATLSHFEAQDQMEHGASAARPLSGGFLGRWLRAEKRTDALAALAFSAALPESLRGAPAACAVRSLDEIAVTTSTGDAEGFAAALASLHADDAGPRGPAAASLRRAAYDSLGLLSRIADLRGEPDTGGDWPRTDLGLAFAQVARVIRKEVGLRVAAIDHGGFDTHYAQGVALRPRLVELAEALAAFERNLGPLADRATTVCVTEFGRRVHENASLGTDHGRASCAFVVGGGVEGGRVVGRWPGLREEDLDDGNLRVTTDYRDLFAEILARRFGATDLAPVFPGHRAAQVGAMR